MSSEPTESSPAAPSPRLSRALRQVLRPLVRLMLAHGVTFRPASDLLNQVYVEVATAELERDGKKPTDSRLSVMTGIHRKALRQQRNRSEHDASVPKTVALGAQLVARWTSDPIYCDGEGRPRPLPRRSDDDAAPSFDGLVRSVSSDVHPRTVLDEWLRLGVIDVDEGDQSIHLVTSAFVPARGFEEKLFYLGRNVQDHLETAVHNLEGNGPARLERSVHYDGLDPEDVSRLAHFAEQEGMKLLEEINRRARELREESSRARGDAGDATSDGADEPTERSALPEKAERMNFGLYFHRGPARGPTDEDDDEAAGEDEGGAV